MQLIILYTDNHFCKLNCIVSVEENLPILLRLFSLVCGNKICISYKIMEKADYIPR